MTQKHGEVLLSSPVFLREGSKSQPPPFQLKSFMRKYKERVFCMQGSGALPNRRPKTLSDGQANVYKGFKNKTKQENLGSLFSSLLLLCQSHSGCLLTDRAEELERTVGKGGIKPGVIGRLWALEPSEAEFTTSLSSQPQFRHL